MLFCLCISYSYIGKHTSLLTSAPPWKWYNVNLLFEDPLNQVREPYEILGSLEYTVEGAISNQSTFLAKGEDWKRGWFYNDDLPPKISFQNLHFQFIEGSVNLSEVQCSQLRNNRPIKCSLFFAAGQAAIFWTRQHNLGRWVVKIRGLAPCETFQTHSLPRDSTLLVLHTRRWRALNMCEKIQLCCLLKKVKIRPTNGHFAHKWPF